MAAEFQIPATRTTPRIAYRPGDCVLEIAGQSYPENAVEFYKPVEEWLEAQLSTGVSPMRVELRLDYFNTSSSKCLLDVLEILEEHYQDGQKIEVVWYYKEDDEDMLESGRDFSEDLTLPFQLVAV